MKLPASTTPDSVTWVGAWESIPPAVPLELPGAAL
jgi:hypothetical protein